MNDEYKMLDKHIGDMVQIIFSPNETYYSRILCVAITDNDKIMLYLTNGIGVAIISKNANEYNQYAIQFNGLKLNKGMYTSKLEIDHNALVLNAM